MKEWETLNSKIAFDHKWYKVQQDTVKLPNGVVMDDYFMGLLDNAVLVLPVTQEGKIIFVRQYKHAAGKIVVELPAGLIGKEEQLEIAAQRELEEETGYTYESLEYLGKVTDNPTKTIQDLHLFMARDCKKTKETSFDISEDIEVLELTPDEVIQNIMEGKIWVTGTISAVFMGFKKLGFI